MCAIGQSELNQTNKMCSNEHLCLWHSITIKLHRKCTLTYPMSSPWGWAPPNPGLDGVCPNPPNPAELGVPPNGEEGAWGAPNPAEDWPSPKPEDVGDWASWPNVGAAALANLEKSKNDD